MSIRAFLVSLLFIFSISYFSVPARSQSADHVFTAAAASGGMAEVKLGQLAQTNGSSDAVKQFGARMVTDHSKANDQLKQAASSDGLTVPQTMDKSDQATVDRLSKISGAEFDKAYANQMVEDHRKDVAAFQKESQSGTSPNVKQFASQTLPTLRDHLKMAEAMQKTVSSGGRQ